MKKTVLLNSYVSNVIAKLGHTDTIIIGDAGLPIPCGPERIDLAVTQGIPSFLEVLKAVLSELEVEQVTIACEMKDVNSPLYKTLHEMFSDIRIKEVRHNEFKNLTRGSKAMIRTGETKPYANVILESGVTF